MGFMPGCNRKGCNRYTTCTECGHRFEIVKRGDEDPYEARSRRDDNRDKAAYGRGSTSGGYGRSSYGLQSATFDGLPALKRHVSGKTEFFYGTNAMGEIDLNDIQHGHAVIRNGKLVYKRRPGESSPVVDRD